MARPGFAASGKSRIASGSSSPQKASVPFGGPEKALTAPSSEGAFLNGKFIKKSLPLTREVARLRRVGRRENRFLHAKKPPVRT